MSGTETPSQQIVRAANVTETIIDATGRQIDVRRTTTLEIRRFIRMLGAAADIDRWFGEASLAAQVRGIDGAPVPMPQTAEQVDLLVDRLGAEGLTAVANWITPGAVPGADPAVAKN